MNIDSTFENVNSHFFNLFVTCSLNAVVLINGDEATVKRVIKKDRVLILEAANPKVENRYFTQEEVETLPVKIIGRVLYTKHEFYAQYAIHDDTATKKEHNRD